MSGSVHTTLVGAYVERERISLYSTSVGTYAETERKELYSTLVGIYVEVQEEEKIYDTVILPQGVGALVQNVPVITLTRR